MARLCLPGIMLLAALLHGVGIARSSLPAQDGLKFLRVARQFHQDSWGTVVRGTDQHPLYPALIALAQPALSPILGNEADSWRIAAQVVSALASLILLIPLFMLARGLFNETTAVLTTLLFVLLPLPARVGHDTLSDPVALLAITTAFACGLDAMQTGRLAAAIGCGIASGLGFLARPEVAVVPMAVVLTWGWNLVSSHSNFRAGHDFGVLPALCGVGSAHLVAGRWAKPTLPGKQTASAIGVRRIAALSVAFLALVGPYTVVKGEVSEKLSLRRAAALSSKHDTPATTFHSLPPGLDDARWDFAAKEEGDREPHLGFVPAVLRFFSRFFEAMGYVLVPLAAWGALRVRAGVGSRLIATYAIAFVGLLVRHAMGFGYLSSRHTLSLVVIAVPFAAAGLLDLARLVRSRLESRGSDTTRTRLVRRSLAVALIVGLAVGAQWHRPPHASRWGHGAAGRWLATHAAPGEKVLDTRGWATFVSGRPAHDYWHVKQALVDPALSYVVVGEDERTAPSRRGETLRAVLAYAAEPVTAFPDRQGSSTADVRVYRFLPPTDWEGMRP